MDTLYKARGTCYLEHNVNNFPNNDAICVGQWPRPNLEQHDRD